MEKKLYKLPQEEEYFMPKLNEALDNFIVKSHDGVMKINKELIPEEYLKIQFEEEYSFYPPEITDLISVQIESIMDKINDHYPFKKYTYFSQENIKSTGLPSIVLNNICEIFEEIIYVLFFYNYETSFCDNKKELLLSQIENRFYFIFKTLFLKKQVSFLIEYLEKRNAMIENEDFTEMPKDPILPLANHWTLGNEDIGNFLFHLDIAVLESRNKVSYRIEYFDNTHVLLSTIFTINIK